jgi:hypothetical protein
MRELIYNGKRIKHKSDFKKLRKGCTFWEYDRGIVFVRKTVEPIMNTPVYDGMSVKCHFDIETLAAIKEPKFVGKIVKTYSVYGIDYNHNYVRKRYSFKANSLTESHEKEAVEKFEAENKCVGLLDCDLARCEMYGKTCYNCMYKEYCIDGYKLTRR